MRPILLLAALCLPTTALAGKLDVGLELVGSYDTGLGTSGAEIVSIRGHLAAITNIAGSIDLVDLSDPAAPELVLRIDVDPAAGAPNSVALHPEEDYLLVVTGTAGKVGKLLAYDLDGELIASADTGIQPDSVAISPNGKWAVVANEAEGVGNGNDGGDGSLSLVDLRRFPGRKRQLDVQHIELPDLGGTEGFSEGRADDLARLPIDNSPGTLEPESIAFDEGSRFAYVTLQENSGVIRLRLRDGHMDFWGTGQTTHLADINTADGVYDPATEITLFREPDGIALEPDGRVFFTADEGDTRQGNGSSGIRGGRTVSAFDARTGELLGDTGSLLDDTADLAGVYPDARSNRGGSEPEVLDATCHRNHILVAVGLERGNSVVLLDMTDPADPQVLDIETVGLAPEGVKFFRLRGKLYVASANEADGTVSILAVR